MGVSLERVQFKFASIIGELCSEPDVLSQFAVWLDLRLAEYKLKGAISLDCSGEEPDPVWLKGLNKAKKIAVEEQESSLHSSSHTRHAEVSRLSESQLEARDIPDPHSHTALSAGVAERLSPDIVVVKDEPSEVYPVGLHVHENMDSSFTARRKRPAETVSSEHWSHDRSSASPKHRRISSAIDSPSNQSLMSVLHAGGYQGDRLENDSKGDNSVLASSSNTVLSSPVAGRSSADLQGDSAEFSDSSLNNSQSLQDIGWMTQSGVGVDGSFVNAQQSELGGQGTSGTIGTEYGFSPVAQQRGFLSNQVRRQFIRDINTLAKPTIKNMVVSAGTFERWLWGNNNYNDKRMVFEIPPVVLDGYLADFFANIKTPNGADYKPRSLESLRWGIDRYLKSTGYGDSIITSKKFPYSVQAFKIRMKLLSS